MNGNGEIAETGTVAEAKNGLSLYLPAEEAYRAFTRINTTELREYSSGESHFAVDEFFLPDVEMFKDESAFEAAGLTDFCSADGGSYLLRDGIRELEFTVICCTTSRRNPCLTTLATATAIRCSMNCLTTIPVCG